MDWEKVETALGHSFRARPKQVGSGVVVQRRKPLPLAAIIESVQEPEERNDGVLESWPGEVSETLREFEAEESLLGFYWDGFGPISWVAGISLVGTRKRRYLGVWDEVQSYRAVAAVEPWDDPLVVSEAVAAYLVCNGRRHGDQLFGSLPHGVSNGRSDLIPTSVLRRALFEYMEWAERVGPGAWSLLAEEHFGRIVEPNHLQRSLDLVSTMHLIDPDASTRDSAAMSPDVRQQLFDEWFATAYTAYPS